MKTLNKTEELTSVKRLRNSFNEIFIMINKENSLEYLLSYVPAGIFKKRFYDDIKLRLMNSKTGSYKELTSTLYLVSLLAKEMIDDKTSLLDYIVNRAIAYQGLVSNLADKDWLIIENKLDEDNLSTIDYIAAITLYVNQA